MVARQDRACWAASQRLIDSARRGSEQAAHGQGDAAEAGVDKEEQEGSVAAVAAAEAAAEATATEAATSSGGGWFEPLAAAASARLRRPLVAVLSHLLAYWVACARRARGVRQQPLEAWGELGPLALGHASSLTCCDAR